MGLLNSISSIGDSIRIKTKFEDYTYIKYLIKKQLGFPDWDNIFDDNVPDKSEQELEDIFQDNANTVYGAIVFEEFLKEYITIFEAKKYIINMMHEFETVKVQDITLDQAISKLRKPVQI